MNTERMIEVGGKVGPLLDGLPLDEVTTILGALFNQCLRACPEGKQDQLRAILLKDNV